MSRILKGIPVLVFCQAFLLCANGVLAQKIFQPKQLQTSSKGILYKTEKSFDVKIHTNGYAIAFNSGKIKNYYTTKFCHIELGVLKDPRERRLNKNYNFRELGSSANYVYGKQNYFLALRGGIGFKKYVSEKTRRRGIALGYSWEAGPVVGLLKPYYLELVYTTPTDNGTIIEIKSEKYSEDNAEKFLDLNEDIFGGAGFFNRFDEWSFIPGIQGKIALHLSKGAFDKKVRAVDLGIMADLFSKRVPIMIETEEVSNKPYFINAYLNIHFGFRSN